MIAQDNGRVGSNWVLDSPALLLESGLPALCWIVELHRLGIERVRIETTTRPPQHLSSLWMPAIADSLQELRVPRCAAYIFWRTSTRASDAAWIGTRVGRKQFLEFERVLPVITEVVAIPDRIRSIRQVPRNRDFPAGQARPLIRHFVVRNADSLNPAGLGIDDDELVQVVVLPPHRVLDRDVEVPE
jgi:hypothetical protein